MVRSCLLAVLTVAISLFAFGQQPKPGKVLPLKRRIPAANSAKYPSLREPSDWQNPFLTVLGSGIEVGSGGDSPAGPTLAAKDVADFLTKLPNGAWPYGLVVVVAETGVVANGDEPRMRRNYLELMRTMRRTGIAVYHWPTTQ